MSFSHLYDFLERLQQNNHKAWMDANRKEYHAVRDFFVKWLDEMNDRLAAIDPDYFDTPGKNRGRASSVVWGTPTRTNCS